MFRKINKAKFIKRALSALILAPVALGIVWDGGLLFAGLILLCAAFALYEWSRLALETRQKFAALFLGALYISAAFWCCYWLRVGHSASVALLFMGMVWMSDSSAYLAGKLIGGPKISGEISPNKTWAGFAGAMAGPAVLCFVFFLFGPDFTAGFRLAPSEILMSVALGFIIGLVGQAGDLLVSFLKRQAGAKDSGQLIPGHGGILDRLDAMMLAAPVFLFILSRFTHVFTG